MINVDEMITFALQLKDEICLLEHQRDKLEGLINQKQKQLHRLCCLLEIKGISLNDK